VQLRLQRNDDFHDEGLLISYLYGSPLHFMLRSLLAAGVDVGPGFELLEEWAAIEVGHLIEREIEVNGA